MNILVFSYKFYPDIGGIESISQMLAEYFTDKGHNVHIITTTKNAGKSRFPFKVISNPFIFKTVSELKWADIVFENNPCFSLSYPNFFISKPSVISLQTWLSTIDGKVRLRQLLKKYLLKSASKVIACSKAVSEIFPEAVIIPNPYNQQLFKRIEKIDKTKDFVFLGRLVSDKGADIAIRAFAEVIKNFPYASLTIIGDGEEMPAMKILVNELNLKDRVAFKGLMKGEELVSSLNKHKFLLVPSLWKEPFGIVALEGIACGCIPIVSDGGGLPEAIGQTGLVFSRGDIKALTDCMLEVLKKDQPMNVLDAVSIQHLQKHEIPVIAEQYLQVFESVINKNAKVNYNPSHR